MNLPHFEEAFASTNWMVRIFRVRPWSNTGSVRFDDIVSEPATLQQLSGFEAELPKTSRVHTKYPFKNDITSL